MIEIRNLTKIYRVKAGVTTRALDGISVNFPETGMVFLVGKSGSGKSTLLNIIGGLDRPDEGEIIVKGRSSKDFSPSDFDSYRNTCVGFVFQEYNLLNEFSIQQNIALALQLQGRPNDTAAVEKLLETVDLAGFGKRKPNTLSGGQKQRVAIARALIKEPEIILADEPTGALDSATGRQVLDTLKKLSATRLVVIVTHDRDFAEFYGDRIIELSDGKILSDLSRTAAEEGEQTENVRQISPGTFCIRDAARLTDEELARIGTMLRSQGGQAVITADASSVDNAKRACGIREDGTRGSFAETGGTVPAAAYDGSRTHFIKSHLPMGHAFRMGASALPKKPVRLLFTVLLSVVSFVMFGIFSTLMLYNPGYSVSKALREADYDAAVIAKNFDVTMDYRENGESFFTSGEVFTARFTKRELEERNRKNGHGLSFAGIYYIDSYFTEERPSATPYCPVDFFTGFTDCGENYMKENGFSLIAGRHPQKTDEVAVTEYICELFRENGFIGDNGEMLGRKLTLYGRDDQTVTLTVTGIYRVGEIPGEYDLLKEPQETLSAKERLRLSALEDSLTDMLSGSFHTLLYVSDDFYGFYTENFTTLSTAVYGSSNYIGTCFSLQPVVPEERYFSDAIIGDTVYIGAMLRENSDYVTYYDLNGKETPVPPTIGDRDILLPLSCYTEGISECCYYNERTDSDGKLRIAGYYTMEYLEGLPVVSEAFCTAMTEEDDFYYSVIRTDYVREADEQYDYLITLTDNSKAEINYLLEKDEKTGSRTVLCSGVYEELQIFITAVKFAEKVFLWIGIVMGAFASLLLFNFISVSIAAKKKEMGILRAMGARGSDVFKVFYAEAGVIAMISFLLSTVFTAVLCSKGNAALRAFTLIRTSSLLDFNILNVLILLAISFAVSAAATFIPVLTAARKAPVETIRVA